MPKVFYVKKARKDNPAVKKGEPYYYWSFRFGGKRFSKTPPRPSQLTQSKWSSIYAAQEEIEDAEDIESLKAAIEDAQSTIEDAASEYEEAAESFGGEGPNQERAERCNELRDELEEALYACDEEVDCESCDGGTIPCDACDAEGRLTCPECGGDCEVECPECDGQGEDSEGQECEECEGSCHVDCPECGGSGDTECDECGGSGDEECSECGGSGTVELHMADENTQSEKLDEIKSMAADLDWGPPC